MVAVKTLIAGILGLASILGVIGQNSAGWPVHTDGLTDLVEWDHYSFIINGHRLFVFSGEFHYWRYPVPELWRDLLEKVKAAGFNAFSIYNHWGYHNPTPGILDFETGAHNFTLIMELAKEIGLYMIVRPGPYVNAEANAGGFPLWVTTGAYGTLRNNDTKYTKAWTPYWTAVSEAVAPHLITNGGNVVLFQIENELGEQWTNIADRIPDVPVEDYMALLEETARNSGINVPFTANAPNMNGFSWSKDFSNSTGNVDVAGLDSYPSCWSCNLSECTGTNGQYVAYQTVYYYDYFQKDSPTQPNFMPEFQGGSYNPWGGPQGGCPGDIGADFANLFYRNLISQRITAVSLYMLFGGTSWGWHAAPVVATSYDYSSPVSENRVIGNKYYETKLLTQFTLVAKDLPKADRLGNSTAYSTNAAILTSELRNPDTGSAFYVTQHAYSPSADLDTFKLKVNTSAGPITIPQFGTSIALNGHQSKIIPVDFSFGHKSLLYSTAEVLTYAIIEGKEVLALWVPTGESGEFTLTGINSAELEVCNGCANVNIIRGKSNVTVSFTQNAGMSVINLGDGSKVVLLDRSAAYLFWSPNLSNDPIAPENETILVQGPYLLRSASIKGASLALAGDVTNATTISIFAPQTVKSVTWNGEKLAVSSSKNGPLTARLKSAGSYSLPDLNGWKYADSLPEVQSDYSPNSKAWVVADHTNTSNPTKPASNNPVLYVDDYHIHVGTHIFRATFETTSSKPTGVYLSITGGTAFGYSVWLNSKFIGSWLGLSFKESASVALSFANATLNQHGDNVLVIVMDNSGHDETSGALNPRGITNATLLGPGKYSFREWRIAGTAGFENVLDTLRGPLNEGGLYSERTGMHLPGYNDGKWASLPRRTTELSVPGAGIRVFRTKVTLSIPSGLDVSISFRLTAASNDSNQLRALIFVNGYQYGRFNPYIGNQINFPVPPGILNYNGENTIAVTVWSQSAQGAKLSIDWNLEYVHSTSYDFKFDSSYLRPGWTAERLEYQ